MGIDVHRERINSVDNQYISSESFRNAQPARLGQAGVTKLPFYDFLVGMFENELRKK